MGTEALNNLYIGYVGNLKNQKSNNCCVLTKFGFTKLVRVKGQETSWCKERSYIVIEQKKWAQRPSIIYISARSGISKIKNPTIAVF
jgi:hypothetical protein